MAAVCVAAQPVSVYTNDTTIIHDFRADSMKYGNTVSLTSSSANALVVLADDTANAGFATDSIKFDFGVQYGVVVVDSTVGRNKKDTLYGPHIRGGTMSTLAADTAGKWVDWSLTFSTDSTTGEPPVIMGVMDSSNVNGMVGTIQRFTSVYPAHMVRPWFKALTGCRTADGFIKLRCQVLQLTYLPVRQQ